MYRLPVFDRSVHTMTSFVDDNLVRYFEDGQAAGINHWAILDDLLGDAYHFRVTFGCHPSDEDVVLE